MVIMPGKIAAFAIAVLVAVSTVISANAAEIIVDKNAPDLEKYAASELQRYLYQVTGEKLEIVNGEKVKENSLVLGDRNSALIKSAPVDLKDVGPQGYRLKKAGSYIVIAGADPEGVLYGVYGLLEDHYGVRFLMSGDVIPGSKTPFRLVDVDEEKTPRQAIRGFTSHWCYMQGAGTWSLEDWKFHIDQMARMRLNMLSIHNYIFEGYRENWLNWDDFKQKNFNQNSAQGGFYHWCSWPLREYPGRSADLFDDYAFGSAASMHDVCLSNKEVWERCASTFQQIIAHAHRRGVKVALGTEFHRLKPDEQKEICESILAWYPDLDYLVYYRHEGTQEPPFVRSIYDFFRQRAPKMGQVLTGWGQLSEVNLKDVPNDVVAGPFTAYSDSFENGNHYGQREYWAGPWLEEDNKGDMHYMPWSKNLAHTVSSYVQRDTNMKGLVTLTWRLTDAIDPRLFFIAAAPWDLENKFTTSRAVYLDYSRHCYGAQNAEMLADILDQNEALASDPPDCRTAGRIEGIPPKSREDQIRKADSQLAVIDACMNRIADRGQQERLNWLRNRILGVRLHSQLAGDPSDVAEAWARSYLDRTMDMSSLGQLVSNHQMIMQLYIVKVQNDHRASQQVKYPSHITARQSAAGVELAWRNEEPAAKGFNVYRNDKKLNAEPLSAKVSSFTFKSADVSGIFRVSVLGPDGSESLPSAPVTVDTNAPRVVVISPPSTARAGQPLDIEARVSSGFVPEEVSAELRYRGLGAKKWVSLPMNRRCRAIFAARIPAGSVSTGGIEYQIVANAGGRKALYPATAPEISALITVEAGVAAPKPSAPASLTLDADGKTLRWPPASGNVFWYRIYRSKDARFTPGRENFLTYVFKNTLTFTDREPDFEDRPLTGVYYYRVTTVDRLGNESQPTRPVRVENAVR
jgi:hypothetical protein